MLKRIKNDLLICFIQKWTHHEHHVNFCNKTITIDGNWKLFRAKCLEEDGDFISREFGSIPTGCRETPSRGSYHCEQHSSSDCKFYVNGHQLCFNPLTIKPTRLSI